MKFTYTKNMIQEELSAYVVDFERYYNIRFITHIVDSILKRMKIESNNDFESAIIDCVELLEEGEMARIAKDEEWDEDNLEEW